MKLSGTAAGFWIAVTIIVVVGIGFAPGYVKPERYAERCVESHSVIVDGTWVGCVGDSQTAGNLWIPPNGPAPMADIKELDDSWMDGS